MFQSRVPLAAFFFFFFLAPADYGEVQKAGSSIGCILGQSMYEIDWASYSSTASGANNYHDKGHHLSWHGSGALHMLGPATVLLKIH